MEDDYDSEFRLGGRPLDPLQSLHLAPGKRIDVAKAVLRAAKRGVSIQALSDSTSGPLRPPG